MESDSGEVSATAWWAAIGGCTADQGANRRLDGGGG
jgi:hypothetical protein